LVVRRGTAVIAAALVVLLPATAAAAPAAPSGPGQERPTGSDGGPIDRAVANVATGGSSGLAGALDDLEANVTEQLQQLDAAEKAVAGAVATLADKDNAVTDTEARIEELTSRSDEVVVDAFVMPPAESAFDVLVADTMADVSMKQAVLDIRADEFASALAELDELKADLEEQLAAQEAAVADAEAARADAAAELADLESVVGQQAQFVLALEEQLASGESQIDALARTDPERAALLRSQYDQLVGQLEAAKVAAARRRALEAIAAEQRRRELLGIWVCPVNGPVNFSDTWGAARSGGRSHKGTDMMAAYGVPTVAPVSGRVEHRTASIGGMSWWVYGDDGNTYFGTHLSGYENVGAGHVERGAVIGYVGESGNATTPHLHFEFHPGGGGAVNPYARLVEACS
jgi:murein DD-endopeptidase MepM/ murein hydrolase activator NlpD